MKKTDPFTRTPGVAGAMMILRINLMLFLIDVMMEGESL